LKGAKTDLPEAFTAVEFHTDVFGLGPCITLCATSLRPGQQRNGTKEGDRL